MSRGGICNQIRACFFSVIKVVHLNSYEQHEELVLGGDAFQQATQITHAVICKLSRKRIG